ncbi:MAG TPA: GerMN domain-containing protein [Firmicutes bacterium]|nr:GerMN domain-containing protein [Bacillota bacterium]
MKGYRALLLLILASLVIAGYALARLGRVQSELTTLRETVDKLERETRAATETAKRLDERLKSLAAKKVVLYFAQSTPTEFYLGTETRDIEGMGAGLPVIARRALEELVRGPSPRSKLERLLPSETRVLGVSIKDHTAYADFSREIQTRFPGGSRTEELMVYSIVNTLTQFPEIKSVQILVEGKKIDTIGGHIGIMQPLTRDERLVRDSG